MPKPLVIDIYHGDAVKSMKKVYKSGIRGVIHKATQGTNFEDSKYIYYNGEAMVFKFESIEEELNVSGNFYFGLIIDGIEYFSEIFAMHPDIKNNIFSDRFVKIEFCSWALFVHWFADFASNQSLLRKLRKLI